MKFAVCALPLVLAVLARQQVAAVEMKQLARGFINRYTSSNGFDQLNTLVTSAFAGEPRNAEIVFKEIERFLAKPESKKPKSSDLAQAAERFLQLKRVHGQQSCQLESLRSMFKLHESLNLGLPETFSIVGPINTERRQLLRIFRHLGREHARLCLARYQDQWAQMISRPDWFGGREEERRVSQRLLIFQEETNELSCEHRFESVRPSVLYLECALSAAPRPFSEPDHAHSLKLALERIQLLHDSSQKALSDYDAGSDSLKPKSEAQIKEIVAAYLREPCETLMANEAATRVLKGLELFAAMFGLPDELFAQYNAVTDHLVKWTGRLVLCERLLERSDSDQLAQALSQGA